MFHRVCDVGVCCVRKLYMTGHRIVFARNNLERLVLSWVSCKDMVVFVSEDAETKVGGIRDIDTSFVEIESVVGARPVGVGEVLRVRDMGYDAWVEVRGRAGGSDIVVDGCDVNDRGRAEENELGLGRLERC